MLSENGEISLWDGDPETDGICIGIIIVKDTKPMQITKLLVSPYYREHGLGTMLLNQALQEVVGNAACTIEIRMKHGQDNKPNRANLVPWLSRFGFIVTDSTVDRCVMLRTA